MWIMLHHRRILVLIAGLLLLVACGAPAPSSQSAAASNGTLGAVAQAASNTELQGTLRLNGSSALLPLMRLVTDVFQSTHPNVHFIVAGSKSSAGRQLVCTGSINIGTSDVPLTAEEKTRLNCADAVETPIAIQAFAPAANPHGPGPVTSLTKAQLVAIFAGQITNWQAVGGDNQAIMLINRVSGSGTRANMANYLFAGDDSKFAPSGMEGENAEVEQAVRETPGAISYLGFAYVSSAGLRVFAIDNVAPTRENVQSGVWPIGGKGYAITKGPPSPDLRPATPGSWSLLPSSRGAARDREFHQQAKAVFAVDTLWAGLKRPAMFSHALGQAGETVAAPATHPFLALLSVAIVGDLGASASVRTAQLDPALPRAAMPDHVGHALAHGPGQHRVCCWRHRRGRALDRPGDSGGFQELARSVQLALERRLPIASDGLTHLAQGLAGYALDLLDLCGRTRGPRLEQAPREFALEGDQRQVVAQEVVEITRWQR
jgi:phosphate transport system substrate-binding protein